ncbi:endonuclease/exonuclease/phosphatase family protein [Janthinobacterium agaricidamnosum]|uniref:Endonuclease/Exonuclease/phosphatase family protein n=1 Tax=Janthinobacterium agaricidamnosum NBRC 102515 = DSM 9628 TaxID=1349767 RepID=W0V0Y0_9BURK|nr:endonuclease/exonuclease/phosphatase family protein [Janthinobacterium agaricidamnosum]CDG81521.1 endonuclease/Exonuclease/phosphatase family protein [Janthinobacterium agaricidamnosum NBRC 102515 = DSM 9628]
MQQEIRFATFNVCNLGPVGAKLYDNLEPLTPLQYEAKVNWTARQLDRLDADVIGFQEIFSQAVLLDVLSRTEKYRGAWHAGFDADLSIDGARLTPNVALVSRLPLAGPAQVYAVFPEGLLIPGGNGDHGADRFARAPLHAQVLLPDGRGIDVLVIHLKSRRPDYRNGDDGKPAADTLPYAMANLRSLIRRGAEAVALRVLLSQIGQRTRQPRIVLGDFNDVADAVTTGIVLGAGASLDEGHALADRMYDSRHIQLRQDFLRHVAYTNVHDGHYMTIDHILVSEEFNPASRHAIGAVLDVIYLNDHLLQALPEASDHGQVLARIRIGL